MGWLIIYLSIYCYVYVEYLSRRHMGSHFLNAQDYKTLSQGWFRTVRVTRVNSTLYACMDYLTLRFFCTFVAFKNIYENSKSTGQYALRDYTLYACMN